MAMTVLLARIRPVIGACAIIVAIGTAMPAVAQQRAPDGAPNPSGSVVNERTLLKKFPRVQGHIDIPDTKAGVLIQPAGRNWDYFHEVVLHWAGALVILGTIALLGAAYLIFGPVRISAGRSGQKVLRFNAFERFAHWLTAVSFVILGLTGLNITFGKILLLPVIGPDAFSSVSEAAKYVHNFMSFSFVVGLAFIVVIFFKDNFFQKVDMDWLKQGGGFVKSKHAPAGRFNLGEKLVYWLALVAGVAISASGYLLMVPFSVTDIAGMQIAEVVHAVVAVLFIALILAHIYIGTLGMEGAFEAMGTGEVDLNWAKEHHDVWLREQLARERSAVQAGAPATPTELSRMKETAR
jgi:formate dehydrogenase subunit gamma